jgi:hypothetical protein
MNTNTAVSNHCQNCHRPRSQNVAEAPPSTLVSDGDAGQRAESNVEGGVGESAQDTEEVGDGHDAVADGIDGIDGTDGTDGTDRSDGDSNDE